MTTTARFGLTLGDNLSDHDKTVIDVVLAALETHDHKGGNRVVDPTTAPTAVLSSTGGTLAAGQGYHYVASFLDRFGLETAQSSELVVTTPQALEAPPIPILTTVIGGTLPLGLTSYLLSGVDAAGNETRLSAVGLVTITDFKTVHLNAVSLDPAIVSVNVYRKWPNHVLYTKIAAVFPVANLPFIDNGSVVDREDVDPNLVNPTSNLTNATSAVLLSFPDPLLVGADPSSIHAVRVYRSLQSGVYGVNSLLVESRTTVNQDGTGGLLTTFLDDGSLVLGEGSPLLTSQTLNPSVRILSGGGGAVLLSTGVGVQRILAAADGALITRSSPGGYVDPTAGSTYLLSNPGRVSWKLGIAVDGSLTTTAGTAGPTDTAYLPGQGPLLPTSDATISYVLGVTDDGALTTQEV